MEAQADGGIAGAVKRSGNLPDTGLSRGLYMAGRQNNHAHQESTMRIPTMLAAALFLAGCTDDAKIASRNLSKSADNFEIDRRIVFYNGITDSYMLTIEGRCSIEDQVNQLEVTCKIGPDRYRKHFLGLSDNVTYFAEQLKTADASAYHHRVTFKPQQIIPDIDFRGSLEELTENASESQKTIK